MCGIAGIYTIDGPPPRREELERMASRLHHRGPDARGFQVLGKIGLGHTRLSIIDLEAGEQPIHNEDRTIWTVFNGEIFNYIELREELEKRGHRFYTHSDTEVIVHAYEEYGEDFPAFLNGQFAIAVWDSRREKLILLRDRIGIHPLFYTRRDGRLLFASEIKALLPLFSSSPRLDPVALDQIMTFWAPVGKTTIFEDVCQILPGEMLVVHNGREHYRDYWQWTCPEDGDYRHGNEASLAAELHDLLRDATRIRLRSDVPVGAYLSGGLDSSVLTALIHQQGAELRTFSIGFDEQSLDEGSYQQMMIDHLGARHSRIQCRNPDVGDAFERALWHTETPILRTAPVPMMLLSGLVHDNDYKVVLTGEGSDEVLGGYDIFKEAKIRLFWARNPQSRFRPLLLKRLYPYLDLSPGKAQSYLQAFFGAGLDNPDAVCFSHIPRWNTTAHCKTFFSDELKSHLRDEATAQFESSLPEGIRRWHPFNRAQYIEAKTLMAGYLLCSQGDRMLMANSVEGRFPFLDHRVIEFANRLPPRLKMKVLNEKYLLKRAMRHALPAEIIQRYKQPYRAPDIPAFVEQGQARDYVEALLDPHSLQQAGYFDPQKVQRLFNKVKRGRAIGAKDNMAFVGILSTQVWHKHFVTNYNEHYTNH